MEQSRRVFGLSAAKASLPAGSVFALISENGDVESLSQSDAASGIDGSGLAEALKTIKADISGRSAKRLQHEDRAFTRVLHDGKRRFSLHCAQLPEGPWILTILPMDAEAQEPRDTNADASHRDALTGLFTRAGLEPCLDTLQRGDSGPHQVFCLYVDLDRFKQINDTLGHDAGDLLLKKVARRLLGCVRETDKVLRLGGDEFVVLGSAKDPHATSQDVSARIVDHVSRPYLLSGNQAVIGASVGVSFLEPGDDIEMLLKKADLALYSSKRNGKGCVTAYHSAMESHAESRRNLDIRLRQALVLGEFEVFFQPQYSLPGNRITGFEALLRLREQDGSFVDAASFLSLAEETRLIVKVGKLVLEEAIRAASQWPDHLNLSINISQVELQFGTIAEDLEHLLTTYGVTAGRVHLEVRENVLAAVCDATLEKILAIKALGVRLSIDKFGDDGSVLRGLFENWVGCVKLNKSKLTSGLSLRDRERLSALVFLSKAAGARVVADSVETEAQLRVARDLGCDMAQGFLFQRAVPFQETLALFDNTTKDMPKER